MTGWEIIEITDIINEVDLTIADIALPIWSNYGFFRPRQDIDGDFHID